MAFWLNMYIASMRTYASFVLAPRREMLTFNFKDWNDYGIHNVTGNDSPIVTGNDLIPAKYPRVTGNEGFHA